MNEQLWLKRGFRQWQCIMTIVLMSVTVASADSGSGESANELVQQPEPTCEEEESEFLFPRRFTEAGRPGAYLRIVVEGDVESSGARVALTARAAA